MRTAPVGGATRGAAGGDETCNTIVAVTERVDRLEPPALPAGTPNKRCFRTHFGNALGFTREAPR
jgi:hypothetical protein